MNSSSQLNTDVFSEEEIIDVVATDTVDYIKEGDLVYKTNIEQALKCYQRAATQNNPEAFLRLGIMSMEGNGVEKDYSQAETHLTQAFSLGLEKSIPVLGILYCVMKNTVKAKAMLQLALSKGYPEAAISLAYLDLKEEKNIDQSVLVLQNAANNGDKYAEHYLIDSKRIPHAKIREFKTYENNPQMLFMLAHRYESNKDYKLTCLEAAAQFNNTDALLELSKMYESNSHGLNKNLFQAGIYQEKAAKIYGNGQAYLQLGKFYAKYNIHTKARRFYEYAAILAILGNVDFENSEAVTALGDAFMKEDKSADEFLIGLAISNKNPLETITALQKFDTNNNPILTAKISIAIARLHLKAGQLLAAQTYYTIVFSQTELLGLRLAVLKDLEQSSKNSSNQELIPKLIELNEKEAETQFKLGNHLSALYFVNTAVKYAEKYFTAFSTLAYLPNLSYLQGLILAEDPDTQDKALNIFKELAEHDYLKAKAKIALADLNGLLGREINIQSALQGFYETIQSASTTSNYHVFDLIVNALMNIKTDEIEFIKQIERILYNVLTLETKATEDKDYKIIADHLQNNQSFEKIANYLSQSSNEKYSDLAFKKLIPLITTKLNNLLTEKSLVQLARDYIYETDIEKELLCNCMALLVKNNLSNGFKNLTFSGESANLNQLKAFFNFLIAFAMDPRGSNDPIYLILFPIYSLRMAQALNHGGVLNVEEISFLIEKNIKQMIVDKLGTTPEVASKIYSDKMDEAKVAYFANRARVISQGNTADSYGSSSSSSPGSNSAALFTESKSTSNTTKSIDYSTRCVTR